MEDKSFLALTPWANVVKISVSNLQFFVIH